jgi:diadenosine tetraphosphate (Ap4A) HIT family hydrolase
MAAPLRPADMMEAACIFCTGDGGLKVFGDACCRVVIADEPFAGFCRVIWNVHVTEMTDLPPSDRAHLMDLVFAVETALRELLAPCKMNLASLGNQVPHLHWHLIPRFADDSHFPRPVWAAPLRRVDPHSLPPDFAGQLGARIAAAIGGGGRR